MSESDGFAHTVSGFFGGVTGILGGQPFDTIRVRYQIGGHYRNAVHCATETIKREGFRALYKGTIPPLLGIGLQNGILFGTMNQALAVLNRHTDSKVFSVMVAGGVAGTAQTLFCTPLEMLKIKQQLNTRRRGAPGLKRVASEVWRGEGVRGMYRGLSVTLLRDVPSYGAYFLAYDLVRDALTEHLGFGGAWLGSAMFISGGLAGVISWSLVYPVDLLKSHIQAASGPKMMSVSDGFHAAMRESNGSYRALWRGYGATMLRAFVVNGLTFVGMEACLSMLT